MELLRELFEIIKAEQLHEGKKRKKDKRDARVPALGMVPMTSFVGGTVLSGDGETMSEGKKQDKAPKPRDKRTNDILRSKKGGPHFDKKKDFKRSLERERTREEFM